MTNQVKVTNKQKTEFRRELADLMERHGVSFLGLASSDCSDWHGITGARLVAEFANGGTCTLYGDNWASARDIRRAK